MSIPLRDIAGFLVASRIPNLLIIGYTQFVTARFLIGVSNEQIFTAEFLFLLLSTGMIGAGGYIINDYFDQKIDMINRPDKVVVGPDLRRRFALVSHLMLSFGGIALGFFIDPVIGLIHVFSTGALWTYSGAIKKVLLLSTLTISFLTILTILIVMIFYQELSILAVVYSLFGCACVFVRETLKDIISAKGEQAFGVHSVPIVWGIRGAKLIIYLACFAGIVLLFLYLISIDSWTVRIFFMALVPFILWFLFRLAKADRLKDFQLLKFSIDFIIVAGLVSMLLV